MPKKGYKTITVPVKTYRAVKLFQKTRGYKSPAEAVKRLLAYAGYIPK